MENRSGKDVIEYYRTRFQIEFCFCDAKSFTGLVHSQARDVAKLSFNFNASLTTVNMEKVLAKERGIPFSMASYKTMIHNAYLLEQFTCVSGIKPNRRLNDKLVKEVVEFPTNVALLCIIYFYQTIVRQLRNKFTGNRFF